MADNQKLDVELKFNDNSANVEFLHSITSAIVVHGVDSIAAENIIKPLQVKFEDAE